MWSIDRFEGEYALCENTVTEERCRIPKAQLPPGAREGSLLRRTPSGWQPAEEEAKARRRARPHRPERARLARISHRLRPALAGVVRRQKKAHPSFRSKKRK